MLLMHWADNKLVQFFLPHGVYFFSFAHSWQPGSAKRRERDQGARFDANAARRVVKRSAACDTVGDSTGSTLCRRCHEICVPRIVRHSTSSFSSCVTFPPEIRDRPKFGFGFGYGAETGDIFSFGYGCNREARFRLTFGYGR